MRRVSVATAALVVAAMLAPTAAAAGFPQQSVDADVVVMNAAVTDSGDAAWTIDYRVRLSDDNETRAFQALRADIRGNESAYTGRFRDRMNRTAGAGENATGRAMAIDNVSVETARETVGQSYGVVTYRFRWANFAVVNETHVRAGDAVAGLYLDRNTSLTMRWPGEYRRASVAPSPDEAGDESVTWRGRQSFGDDEPSVVVTNESQPFRDAAGAVPTLPALGLLVLALALAAVGYGVYRYVRADGGEGDGTSEPAAGGADGDEGGDSAAASAGGDAPPAELLSNEEQVLKLLRENGGRIKQQRVASELDWTAAKTSQVIGGLREDDELETFRIGRENVVTLPGTDLTDVDGEPDEG